MAFTLFLLRQPPELISPALFCTDESRNSVSVVFLSEGMQILGGEPVGYQDLLELAMEAEKVITL